MKTNEHWIKLLLTFAQGAMFKIYLSILLSIISVFAGLVPYWTVYKIILLIINGNINIREVVIYITIAIVAYFIQVICFGSSTMLSHVTAYDILSNIRKKIGAKIDAFTIRCS
ncbi:ABC transporter ATPase/permease [Staphylococcus aureus]|nr:ABC transporter ATPase/permease [Staphylococcus aureus]COW54682.1 ABC transporter ATPase/permease [Staphylococcus aureus]COW60142.1 ABC transporter ATPase/permease [Staphylococcus aureus]